MHIGTMPNRRKDSDVFDARNESRDSKKKKSKGGRSGQFKRVSNSKEGKPKAKRKKYDSPVPLSTKYGEDDWWSIGIGKNKELAPLSQEQEEMIHHMRRDAIRKEI